MTCAEARRVASFIAHGAKEFARGTTVAERGAMTRHISGCPACHEWLSERCKEEIARQKAMNVSYEERLRKYQEAQELARSDCLDPEYNGS